MKKTFLTFAVIALVSTFTSCKENAAENSEEKPAEAMESPVQTPIEEIPQVEEVDSTVVDTLVEDKTNVTL